MSIWGSLIGGMVGFSLGGPFGMLLGSLIGVITSVSVYGFISLVKFLTKLFRDPERNLNNISSICNVKFLISFSLKMIQANIIAGSALKLIFSCQFLSPKSFYFLCFLLIFRLKSFSNILNCLCLSIFSLCHRFLIGKPIMFKA